MIDKINKEHYAVQFDAESVDTVHFDGHVLTNEVTKKRTGRYHALAKILAARDGDFVFPATLVLDPDFTIKKRYFQYLSPDRLLKGLK